MKPLYPCLNPECEEQVEQENVHCENCERKIHEVLDVLDHKEQEIIPGIYC